MTLDRVSDAGVGVADAIGSSSAGEYVNCGTPRDVSLDVPFSTIEADRVETLSVSLETCCVGRFALFASECDVAAGSCGVLEGCGIEGAGVGVMKEVDSTV